MDIIDRIALDLKLDKSYLARIASRSSFYYRDFKIKNVMVTKDALHNQVPN